MIHSNKHIIYFLAGCLSLLVSCTDEEMINKEVEVEEGIPVTTTLSFGTSDIVKVETKATDIDEDNKVTSLAIFVFDKKKEKVGNTHFIPSLANDNSITIPTFSGKKYVYAIANYKSSLFDLETELSGVSTLDDLKKISVSLPDNNISVLDGQFLMSGWFVGNTKEEGYCIIGANGQILNANNPNSDPTIGKIDLKRIMSSVKFKIISTTPDAKFVAESWQVKKLPQQSYLIEQELDYSGSDANYFASKVNAGIQFVNDTCNFSFLMMENRKQPLNSINTTDPKEAINKREEMTAKAENFTNANPNSTYVVIKGTYKGKTSMEVNGDNNEKNVTAFTTYYIHLGDWRGNNYSNFDIFRNNRYTYTVKVVGVDNIIVEVESDERDNESWSNDGDIYMTNSHVSDFDAHYGTTVISFSVGMIDNLVQKFNDINSFKQNFDIVGATPRNNFIPDSVPENLDWVTYKRNTPGSENFMEYKGNREKDAELLDADGLKTDLFNSYQSYLRNEENSGFDSNGIIRYTCFIDEYFYTDLQLTKFINQQPRTINILTYYKLNTETSSNSSINMSTYTFVQRPIYTIYDLDKVEKNPVNGWGAESIQETEYLSSKEIPAMDAGLDDDGKNAFYSYWKNDFDQGRTNMHKWIAKMDYEGDETWNWRWDKYIDPTNNELKKGYDYAQYACLAKNRDLNGDGIIDNDELRWYLPSVNQYTAFVIGSDVLPEDVRLYRQTDKGMVSEYAYVSSTVNANPTLDSRKNPNTLDYYVLLANQGLSISYRKKEKNSYRCVRNLKNVTALITDIAHATSGYYNDNMSKAFSFDNLNSRAKRENVNRALTFGHTNLDEENRLPNAFAVRENIIKPSKDFTAYRANWENPCNEVGQGWRLPNQKELAIMVFHRKQGTGQAFDTYFSCTKNAFAEDSYCGYVGFSLGIQSMTIWSGNTSSYRHRDYDSNFNQDVAIEIRCVKDTVSTK